MSDFSALTRIKKTRRKWSCCWCGESIEAGLEAWKMTGRRDGDFWTYHLHPECMNATQRITPAERDELIDGWDHGEFRRGMTPSESGKAERAELARKDV